MKAKYKESEALFESLVSNKCLRICCQEMDLYGRILIDLFVPSENDAEIHVNQAMIDSKLVFKYDGKTKMTIDQ